MDPTLGFAQLLGMAQGNQHEKSHNKNLLKTKFGANKREKKDKGKLSDNVKKFLEKKEAEERQKKIDEKIKREKLNDMRTDREKNKIRKHLKVTKSANYSVVSDAVNTKDTAITLLSKGRKQCDEDDYGFASNTSQNIYEKLMSKYEADPEDPMAKFSKAKPKEKKDLGSAKERVIEALKREESNPVIPGKRRRHYNDSEKIQVGCTAGNRGMGERERTGKSKKNGEISKEDRDREEKLREREEKERKKDEEKRAKSDKERREEEARRKRLENAKKAPPPVDFQSLLKMANQKKDLPVNQKVEKKKTSKESEFGSRPMTSQELKEFQAENERRLRREGKLPPKEKEKVVERRKETSPELDLRDTRKPKFSEPGPKFHNAAIKTMPQKKDNIYNKERDAIKNGLSEYEKEKREMERKMNELEQRRAELENKHKVNQHNEKKRMDYQRRQEEEKRKEIEKRREERKREDEKKELGNMQSQYKEMQRKMQEMEARLKGGAGKSSASSSKRDPYNVESRSFPGERKKLQNGGSRDKGGYKKRIESDSEDEYDSEMDDFIDDGDAGVDIGREIRSIFGYDKRKYRDEEDLDDRSMENNKFSSIMMEEARSARIGREEDLEDMRREEEENKRKKKRR